MIASFLASWVLFQNTYLVGWLIAMVLSSSACWWLPAIRLHRGCGLTGVDARDCPGPVGRQLGDDRGARMARFRGLSGEHGRAVPILAALLTARGGDWPGEPLKP